MHESAKLRLCGWKESGAAESVNPFQFIVVREISCCTRAWHSAFLQKKSRIIHLFLISLKLCRHKTQLMYRMSLSKKCTLTCFSRYMMFSSWNSLQFHTWDISGLLAHYFVSYCLILYLKSNEKCFKKGNPFPCILNLSG